AVIGSDHRRPARDRFAQIFFGLGMATEQCQRLTAVAQRPAEQRVVGTVGPPEHLELLIVGVESALIVAELDQRRTDGRVGEADAGMVRPEGLLLDRGGLALVSERLPQAPALQADEAAVVGEPCRRHVVSRSQPLEQSATETIPARGLLVIS